MVDTLETNVFEITNLRDLRSKYRLYRIRGLSTEQDEYDSNRQILIKKLSYKLGTPATIIEKQDGPYLVLREDAPEPPSPFDLVRTVAYFDATGDLLELDFQNPTNETAAICQRFLQFAINGLRKHVDIWQPSAGQPFFYRKPILRDRGIDIYRGASIRVIVLEENKLAVCVDVKHKYVSQEPLNAQLSKMEFRRLKGTKCIYHWGSSWYEIRLHELSDLKLHEYLIHRVEGQRVSLKADIIEHAPKPLQKEVTELDDNGSVVVYMTGRDENRGAPSNLCYPTFETNDSRVSRLHSSTILSPQIRRSEILKFVNMIKGDLRFGDMVIKIADFPLQISMKQFTPPDLAFGHGFILSVRGTKNTRLVSLNKLGQSRLDALFNSNIGPYATELLDKQYLIWPRSIAVSYGSAFLKDLKDMINRLYPCEIPYDPELIEYDDSGPKNFAIQGRAILQSVKSDMHQPGYGIVMIHDDGSRKNRHEDQLASMVMRELRKENMYVSVIHSTLASESYELPANSSKGASFRRTVDGKKLGRLNGYLRNVAITKVLLTNERWPFLLATPLNSDLTIGIDIKLHTACFSFIGKNGASIRTEIKDSRQKEKLSRDQVKKIFEEGVRKEAAIGQKPIQSIVIHRDGRLYDTEIKGIEAAFKVVRSEGIIAKDASLNFVEVPKSGPAPIRLLEVSKRANNKIDVENPEVGCYWMLTGRDAYLCSTGRVFLRQGTATPIHIKYVSGEMPFEQILEDIYSLTCLAWTRPEDCARNPLTMKLADIRLREHAGGFDADALIYGEGEEAVENE